VAGGDPLEGIGDQVPCSPLRLGLRLLLELPDAAREIVAYELLRTLEQVRLRLARGHSGDVLQVLEFLLLGLLELLLKRAQVRLAVGQPLLSARHLGQLSLDLLLGRQHAFLDLRHPRTSLRELTLDLSAKTNRLLSGLDLRLAPDRLGVVLRLGQEQLSHPPRCADARGAEEAEGQQNEERREEDEPYDADHFDEHVRSRVDCGSPRTGRGCSPGTRPTQTSRIGPQRGSAAPEHG